MSAPTPPRPEEPFAAASAQMTPPEVHPAPKDPTSAGPVASSALPSGPAALNPTRTPPAAFAPRGWYGPLVALFACLLVIANVAAVKLIGLGEVTLFGARFDVTIDGGAFLFPLTYVIGDVLAEVFGFRATRRAILLGFVCGALAAGTFWLVQIAPVAEGWTGQGAYEEILGFVPRVVGASLAGYLAGQLSNAATLTALKRRSRSGPLWRRLLGSTAVGEAADTVVFCLIAFYGVITGPQFWGYVALGYIYKCLVEVALLPVTYRVVAAVRRHERTMPSA